MDDFKSQQNTVLTFIFICALLFNHSLLDFYVSIAHKCGAPISTLASLQIPLNVINGIAELACIIAGAYLLIISILENKHYLDNAFWPIMAAACMMLFGLFG